MKIEITEVITLEVPDETTHLDNLYIEDLSIGKVVQDGEMAGRPEVSFKMLYHETTDVSVIDNNDEGC